VVCGGKGGEKRVGVGWNLDWGRVNVGDDGDVIASPVKN
jgi:hypothetical protein